ncbi:bifunctional glycosyltransferase family 2/GtrA family protein [Streptococcus sp. DD13]|uniref:bifunctional glycosyltransferase family 2/GtrA family protein n=1 Tax=Streptococcus sp. DD13 TaxID=1777881 RepID=UPI0007988CD0|nr:bifunctional glycosyltransferase family 2/GtrA family protein [Streptococcus sp. DD13]KXT78902.1 hypothetical protein STRDD13_00332 [Streptococcus sp. DD13]
MNYLVIPAYEPDKQLVQLIQKIKEKSNFDIIVVNDGSSAEKRTIFDQIEQDAHVIHHQSNQGKGYALKTAFRYILSTGKFGTVVTADADGQHKIFDILRVANASQSNPNTLVLGSRNFTGKVPLRSAFGNKLTRKLFKLQTGVAITDTQTGLRGFTTNMLSFLLGVEGNRYEYEMNMLLSACKEYPILEVPIETVYINDNEGSHFRPIKDGLMIYKNMLKFALSSVGSFLIDYLVYAICLATLTSFPIGSRILLANTIARIASGIFNYTTNKRLVFKNNDSLAKTGTGYFTLAFVLYALDTLLIRGFYAIFGINLLIVKVIVGLLLFFVSWMVQKKIIFKERPTPTHENF